VVVVDGGDVAAFAFGDDRRLFGDQPTVLEFEGTEALGQGVVVELCELIDNGGRHEFMTRNRRT